MDEADFGRISEPARCWTPMGERPIVPSQMAREYVTGLWCGLILITAMIALLEIRYCRYFNLE